MFIALLFTIAKIWKQPKYPSTDEWIKKVQHTHIYNQKRSRLTGTESKLGLTVGEEGQHTDSGVEGTGYWV